MVNSIQNGSIFSRKTALKFNGENFMLLCSMLNIQTFKIEHWGCIFRIRVFKIEHTMYHFDHTMYHFERVRTRSASAIFTVYELQDLTL